ncbi:BofC C-terminal domain-containing protein [Brevibacillus sp. SAFN-007a]|uniref:BofC C-terminal domain-containing protein n=1 Tax=Brevibacillus sp. SAFN-007a TaxID=3436862 RepID=UPI003F7E0A2D
MREKWMVYASWSAALLTGVVVGILLTGSGGKVNGLIGLLHADVGKTAAVAGKPYEMVLARSYLCGVRDEERQPIAAGHLPEVIGDYKGWEIVAAGPSQMILMKREQDISPACKANGHFGLSADGMLTLFHGVPAEQDVIQTFYRINTAKMEASLPKEELESLKRGIRIRNLAEYNSVLSTYGEFQLDSE